MNSLNPPAPTGSLRQLATSMRQALPRGQTLPYEAWARRHRVMVWILWAHVVALPVFALARGESAATAFGSVVPIALAGVAAMLHAPGRRARSVAVVLGLLTSSAVLVNAWDGQIEAHFHFFVMIAVLALYEDWLPFGLAIAYVVVEHGVVGAVSPHSVYDHGGNPWAWAGDPRRLRARRGGRERRHLAAQRGHARPDGPTRDATRARRSALPPSRSRAASREWRSSRPTAAT